MQGETSGRKVGAADRSMASNNPFEGSFVMK